jgi:hypothetical protein
MKYILVLLVLSVFLLSCKKANDPVSENTVEIQLGKSALVCSALKYAKGVYITAAHCVGNNIKNFTLNNKTKNLKEVFIHEDWDSKNINFDIAIVVEKNMSLIQILI